MKSKKLFKVLVLACAMVLSVGVTMQITACSSNSNGGDVVKPEITFDSSGAPSIKVDSSFKDYKPAQTEKTTLKEGSGAVVKEGQTVTVNYTGWLTDGTQFDSSWSRGEPISFGLNQVITGWRDYIPGSKVGDTIMLIVPPDEGYGSTAQSTIPANSTLVFVVEIQAAK